jgi:lipopolysaccharide export system protein LptC
MMNKSSYYSTFFLLLGVALSTWLYLNTHTITQSTATNAPNNPDQFVEDATVNRTDILGNRQDQITTTHLVHYLQNDAAAFTQPELLIFNPMQPPWKITALIGHAEHDFDTIVISQNVRIEQAASAVRPHSLITTTQLTIYPKQKLATTDQAVTGVQPGLKITAVGLRADMLHNTLDLLSQVRIDYTKMR